MRTHCPYCRTENNHIIDFTTRRHGQDLVLCEPEIGGCDRWYACFWQVVVEAVTRPLVSQPESEGEEQLAAVSVP